VKKKLELNDDQVKESRKVLFERGNMSSATLPHVWHEMVQNEYSEGTLILSLAFGPGLSIFGSLFEVV
jgi:predicted naringenin-chalcone synthase